MLQKYRLQKFFNIGFPVRKNKEILRDASVGKCDCQESQQPVTHRMERKNKLPQKKIFTDSPGKKNAPISNE